jgi:hypothetical protein
VPKIGGGGNYASKYGKCDFTYGYRHTDEYFYSESNKYIINIITTTTTTTTIISIINVPRTYGILNTVTFK